MGKPHSKARRHVTRVIVFLLLGAVINVAVAWGLAYSIEFDWQAGSNQQIVDRFEARGLPYAHPEADRFRGYTAIRHKRFGSERVSVSHSLGLMGRTGNTTISFEGIIPQWARSFLCIPELDGHVHECSGEAHTHRAIVDARGWPCLALWGGLKIPHRRLQTLDEDGKPIRLSERQYCIVPIHIPSGNVRFNEFRWLPWHSIWPGFAINTIFYAAILWMLFFVPTVLRRKRRVNRGLCIHCGYDLRGKPPDSHNCPECGKPLARLER